MAGRLFPDHRSLGRVDLPRRLLHTIQMEIAVVCAGFLVIYFHMRGEKKGERALVANPRWMLQHVHAHAGFAAHGMALRGIAAHCRQGCVNTLMPTRRILHNGN